MRNLLRAIWYSLCKYLFVLISDANFTILTSYITYKRLGFHYKKYDLKQPKTFNEKLSRLKLNKDNVELWRYADKIEVRDYVAKTIGDKYLVPLIGVFASTNDIDFSALPMQFALKTNHGSGWNIICFDKSKLDIDKSVRRLNRWLKYNAFYLSREYQYKPIKPSLLCEELLQYNIYDYKFFCFNGKPEIVQLDIDRFSNHKRAYYDMNWIKQNFSIRYEIYENELLKPIQFEEMKEICQKLSAPFKFVRVDLYIHNSKVYFGELTFFPGGGNEPFNPVEYDYEFGKHLVI